MSSSPTSRQAQDKPADDRSGPIFSKRVWTGTGSVEGAVFDRMVEADRGKVRLFNIVAKRSWKDDEGYQSSNVFRPEDLLPLALFLQLAYEFVANEQARK